MLIITKAEKAEKVFKKYKNCVAYSFSKTAKGVTDDNGKLVIEYGALGFLPDEDVINGIKAGDIKLKTVIKEAKKAVTEPKLKTGEISLGMAQVITMVTSNRKSPVVMVMIEDEEDTERNKILKRYVKAMFKLFGIKPIKNKVLKKEKIFKGKKKKVRERVSRINSRYGMSKKGLERKRLILTFYETELRQGGMVGMDIDDLDREETRACLKNLLGTFTATNLQKIEGKDTCKRMAKKDKRSVKAYKELRTLLKSFDSGIKLPKAKYGQKKKKDKAVGAKMDTKKFVKYFEKKSHRPALFLIYGHIIARLIGYEVGSKDYNAHMKGVAEPFGAEFVKAYVAASNNMVKQSA